MKELKFKIFSASALAPIRSSKGAADYGLFSYGVKIFKEYGCEAIKTDIDIKIPKGISRRIAPCSSLAFKHQIRV